MYLLEIDVSWKPIVELYLQACYQDNKLRREAILTSSVADVFRICGSEFIAERFLAKAKAVSIALLPPPHSSEWQLISNSEFAVTVEISVGVNSSSSYSSQVPFIPTRMQLTKHDEHWQIDDILHPCVGCNIRQRRPTTVGQCALCEGLGHFPMLPDKTCSHCGGNGKCARCMNEATAGWRRASFLEPS